MIALSQERIFARIYQLEEKVRDDAKRGRRANLRAIFRELSQPRYRLHLTARESRYWAYSMRRWAQRVGPCEDEQDG